MAAIHAVDLDAAGLADLGQHEGYIARQLKRWYGQWNDAEDPRARRPSTTCTTRCSQRIPEQGPATIVHGDYRLDNCMVDDDGTVVAVLDWEICTLGDPLADVGLLQVYWTGPERRGLGVGRLGHHGRGLPRPRTISPTRYAEVSGRDLDPAAVLRVVRLLEAGLHPARACTPATSAARSVSATPPSSSRSSLQVDGAAATALGAPGGAVVTEPLHACTSRCPTLDAAGAGGDAHRAGSTPAAPPRRRWRPSSRSATAAPLATFDGDTFIDYRARRPTMELRDGVNTRLRVARHRAAGRPRRARPRRAARSAVPSPTRSGARSPTSCRRLAVELGVHQMVALGAYPFATPHTRPPRLSSSSPSAEVVANAAVPARTPSTCRPAWAPCSSTPSPTRGIPALGIWAQVPHYVERDELPGCHRSRC